MELQRITKIRTTHNIFYRWQFTDVTTIRKLGLQMNF